MADWNPGKPYNGLPTLPPRVDVETTSILKLAIEARSSLAAMNQAARSMTNASVLINAIPLLEAQASSEVENIVTTTDELFMHAEDETSANSATREALRYRTALFEGFNMVQRRGIVTTNTARQVCSIIMRHEMDLRSGSGTYIGNPVTHTAIYTPPEGHEVIDAKLADWELFVNSGRGYDPLTRMAIAHYQFEAVHPFDDGNGRTGRILNVLMLVAAGLLDHPVLYLSRFIIKNKSDYYRRLLAVTAEEAWVDWVEYMLEGVRETANSTLKKIDAVQHLQGVLKHEIGAAISGGGHVGLLDVLFEQPYCRISNVREACGVSRPTATNWLKELTRAGVLTDVRVGRELIFINTRFMDLLVRDDVTDDREEKLF
ncbi:Fic family protein [Arthrobacter tumbae]|uniref:Fic family protein n=1 Tax=Arthrobacter tumbae TaxID=163874 RepID=UPI001EF943CC|nr:Fic family protein [Arthrobacter tumbae]MBM7781171.1 Fic family protein [Arthrobacter tumbae]